MENVEQVEQIAAVAPEVFEKPEVSEERQDKPEKQSLRKTIERNFKASEDKPTNGTQTEPAANKSFVNGDNQQQETRPAETVLAPASMNAEERKIWETLPTEAKKFLSRREYETRSHLTRQSEGYSQKEREVSDILQAVTPEVRAEYTREGIALPDLVRRSIAWDKRVKEGIDGALEFLEAHGYKPEQLANYKSEPEKPEYLTREEAEKLAEEKFQKQFELQQQSLVVEQNANVLQSFIDSKPVFKGDPGTAAQVENAIAEEIEYLKFKGFQGSTAQLLDTAYERAIQNNPAFSSLRAAPLQAAPIAKPENIHEQMERVRAAKAASKSASGSLGSGSPAYKSNSLRESLERNWHKS